MRGCPSCGAKTPDGARFCPDCGFALGAGPAPEGHRKVVTIVFCDLVDSTALAERLDPEMLRQVIAQYFRSVSAVLEGHQGAIEKFIGDAVMAVFGVPAVREDDALRAVRAAAGMRSALAELNERLERRFGVTLTTRTGVNTGEVIAGDPSRGHGFVSGDAVNVAARLEQAAPRGEILIGERTLELVRHVVTVEPVAPLELKGKAQRVPAFRLLDVDVAPSTGDGPGLTSRSSAASMSCTSSKRRSSARSTGAAASSSRSSGPPASASRGSSTSSARRSDGRGTIAIGRCVSYGTGLTFWPLREVVAALAGRADGDSTDEIRSALVRMLEGDDDAEQIVELVAGALGWSESVADPRAIFWAMRKLLEAAAAERPLVIVLEDIHWAEPILLDLIEHLARRSAPCRF